MRSSKQNQNYLVYVNCLLEQAFGNPNGFLHAGVYPGTKISQDVGGMGGGR